MRPTSYLHAAIVLMAGCWSTSAAAGDGCLINGSLTSNGIYQAMHYCAANKGMSNARFSEHCKELHAAQLEGLTPSEARKFTLKTVPACPSGFKASCEGAFGEKMNIQYMANDSMLKDGSARLFCQSMDGKWR